ncbi:ATP-binding protein [Parasporobacterium paucivorans]|uniref:Uncharacterized protein YhaN n=1 Tax=Parasporobacterium paucivorans DSM 15970 TaxID=1122934 RepID=A0A1M6IFH6_9FIRM|nr:AAA family ATPase [Parasporobacterium paucivorans]SHJ33165.1 Uncharacterized protein YhaN [Parasporobacterium paucivorans DSM 15970]
MKLIRCNIENFGTLHHFSYEFKDGINTINELNGWGKSTFAAFIKAMFYGMEGTRSRKNLEDEQRKKYKPWQGGAYGGSIEFELKGREYKIERFFGTKAKDDVFKLFNQATGLVSNDYSENIGEEMFHLDTAAYSRSTYIPQNAVSVMSNDSINAKLSSLIEKTDENDINNYESAMKLLENSKKEYFKIGGRGKLNLMKNQLTSLEAELERCSLKAEASMEWNRKLHTLLLQKKDTKENLKIVKGQIEETGIFEAQVARLQAYRELFETEDRLRAGLEPLQLFFKDRVPSDDELKLCDSLVLDSLKLKGELESVGLTDRDYAVRKNLEDFFATGIPEEQSIAANDRLFEQYRENQIRIRAGELTEDERRRMAGLESFFRSRVPEESEINQFIDELPKMNDLEKELISEKKQLELLKALQDRRNPAYEKGRGVGKSADIIKTAVLLSIGLFAAVFGLLWAATQVVPGLVCILAGCVVFVIGIMSIKKRKAKDAAKVQEEKSDELQAVQEKIDGLTAEKNRTESELQRFLSNYATGLNPDSYYSILSMIKTRTREYQDIQAKRGNLAQSALRSTQSALAEQIDRCIGPYCPDLSIPFAEKENIWKQVKKYKNEYQDVLRKVTNFEEITQKYRDRESALSGILDKYFDTPLEEQMEKVGMLKDRRREYIRLKSELETSRIKLEQFTKENDIPAMNNAVAPPCSLSELKEKEKNLEWKREAESEEENYVREQIRTLSEEADRCPELEGEIEQLKEEIEVGEKQLNIINETMECLGEAKDRFATRYMESLKRGFEKYISILDNGTLGETSIDVQFNIDVTSHGAQKSIDYFSAGYRDLIGIAARFALIEALFINEKPFVILDDPFSNLDGEKLKNVLGLMEEIAAKYQLIYFVCHDSRVPEHLRLQLI